MIQKIYWIFATLTMIVLLINAIYMLVKNILNEREFRKYKDKQKKLLEEQLKKLVLED